MTTLPNTSTASNTTSTNSAHKPSIMLVDNGSTRVDAAVQLRQIASKLSDRTGEKVHAVSMQHSNKISEEHVKQKLSGDPALILREFMAQQLRNGQRDFILIPLFFGKSRALTSFVPAELAELESEFGQITLRMADVLYPMPDGDPMLVDILHQHAIKGADGSNKQALKNIVLVDHGSPIPTVTAVRQHITNALNERLPTGITLKQAAMERRKGKEYDFNGELLENYLNNLAESGETQVTVLLLFLLAGTHAGKDGDIVQICNQAMQKHTQLNVSISPLIGQNEILITCLAERLNKVINQQNE